MDKVTVYKNFIGKQLDFTLLEEDRTTPISLTSATVTAKIYAVGSNSLLLSSACSITDATNGECRYTTASGDLPTPGLYYTQLLVTYSNSTTSRTETGPNIEILDTAVTENLVSVDDFLDFLSIKSQDAKSDISIKAYLEQAESILNCDIPSIESSTNSKIIKIKQTLIKMKAAQFYFMNSDEFYDDPNKRNAKIELWSKEYNRLLENLNSTLSTDTETGSAVCRRKKSSEYSNSSSYLYGLDTTWQ